MRPIFKEKVVENEVCKSREQCTGPTSVHCSRGKVNNHGLKK